MTVKAEIKAAFDTLNMGFVKASIDTYKSKTLLRKKALAGGSIGPLTVTNAHVDRNVRVQGDVLGVLKDLKHTNFTVTPRECYVGSSCRMTNLIIEIPLDAKRVREIKFTWELHPTYASRDLDPGYLTYWYVMDVEDKKVA